MAAVGITEVFTSTGTLDKNRDRTYQRSFFVYTDELDDDAKLVLEYVVASVGAIGDTYAAGPSTDDYSYIQNITVSRNTEYQLQWTAVVDYGPEQPEEQNPLEEPIEVSWDFAQFELPMDTDWNGVAVVNTAGVPFDPPVMRDDSRPVLTVVRNERDYSYELADLYRDSVNESEYITADISRPPGTVKVAAIPGRRLFSAYLGELTGDPYYWQVTYQFHFNRDGWKAQVLNAGRMQIVSGNLVPIVINGVPVTDACPLDASGARVLPANTPGDCVILEFQKYKEIDFASAFNF